MKNNLFYLPRNSMKNLNTLKKIGVTILIIMLIIFYILAFTTLFL